MKNNQTQKNFILGIKITFFHPQLSIHPTSFSPTSIFPSHLLIPSISYFSPLYFLPSFPPLLFPLYFLYSIFFIIHPFSFTSFPSFFHTSTSLTSLIASPIFLDFFFGLFSAFFPYLLHPILYSQFYYKWMKYIHNFTRISPPSSLNHLLFHSVIDHCWFCCSRSCEISTKH